MEPRRSIAAQVSARGLEMTAFTRGCAVGAINHWYLRDRIAAAVLIAIGAGLTLTPYWESRPRALDLMALTVILLTPWRFTIGLALLLFGTLLVTSEIDAWQSGVVLLGMVPGGCGVLLLWKDVRDSRVTPAAAEASGHR